MAKAPLAAVVLAAGLGKRMHSHLPKVLHPCCGQPLLSHVLAVLDELAIDTHARAIIIGHGADLVQQQLPHAGIFCLQKEQLGTGHAVMQARAFLENQAPEGLVLVLCGDTPLLRAATLTKLIASAQAQKAICSVLTAHVPDATGYGRIVRDETGALSAIVEERDATPELAQIKEINAGVYCFRIAPLLRALTQLSPENAQGEYYLTDVIKILRTSGEKVVAFATPDPQEVLGVNTRLQLAQVEKLMRARINAAIMESGITLVDPDTTYIDASVEIGTDTTIYPNTLLEGKTKIGRSCLIGPNSRIRNSIIADEVRIEASIVLDSQIDAKVNIGPFAYLRPGSHIAVGAKIGDFVELKNATIGPGSKVPHLSYIGDATIGSGVNIGAGTITCNYDGKNKHHTFIEDHAFIGSNTNLVAPIRIGSGSLVGAGSTLTQDVPPQTLAIARARQKNLAGKLKKKEGD